METVRHILETKGMDVWSVAASDLVLDALRMMADKDVGALLVFDQGRLVGILSERDYARKVVLLGKTSRETLVRDIMSSDVIVIHPDQTVEEAMELMDVHHIRHMPVIEEDQVIGVISIGDVVRHVIYHKQQMLRDQEAPVMKRLIDI